MSAIDFNTLFNNPRFNLSFSSNANEHPSDAKIRRYKDLALFSASLTLILTTFFFCGYTLLNRLSSYDDKKWATAVAGSIITGMLGYMTGKNVN